MWITNYKKLKVKWFSLVFKLAIHFLGDMPYTCTLMASLCILFVLPCFSLPYPAV